MVHRRWGNPGANHGTSEKSTFARLRERTAQGQTIPASHPDFGHPKLREHLGATVMAMKMNDEWDKFYMVMNRILPRWQRLEDKHGQQGLRLEKRED